jgi:K+:H+ antiporter
MDLWYFIMELVMLLGGAFLLGALAQRLRQSSIVGYLLAGAIVGPLLFNAEVVNQAAELGVSLLLFSIGLEFSFKKLKSMGWLAFGGGTLQIVGTMGLVSTVLFFKTGLTQAVTIGAIVALSSTAVVIRILVDRAEIDSIRGRACLGVLLIQDIAIVPLVILVSFFSPTAAGADIGFHIFKILIAVVGLAVVYYVLLYHIVPFLLSTKTVFADRELTVLLAFSVGIGAAWSSHAIGVSPALGAFVAGLLLGESPYATQIRADIGALRTIMVTLFFASIGMLAKPLWFLSNLHWVLPLALLIFLIKTVITYYACRLFGLPHRQAIGTGISLGQSGNSPLYWPLPHYMVVFSVPNCLT